MALYMLRGLLAAQGVARQAGTRCLSVCPTVCHGKYNTSGSFETKIGACGPLIDGPDYTFLDGRPTPLRSGQRRRARLQRIVSGKVLQLWKETNFAIERLSSQKLEEEQERQRIIESKLKPKGLTLLKKKNSS